ncbi:MAG TPA: hypothetical protein PKA90_02920 [Ignavibacteria bacterium]|nr:hypothetical protein [Ignavibacteria bacterium]HMR39361.1 hypothetical protein [Ignavibacteria bacterium]
MNNNNNDFKYPLNLNSYWYYGTRNFIFDLRPDSINIYFTTDTLYGYGNAKINKDTVVNSDTLTQIRNVHSLSGHPNSSVELFRQTDSGLVRAAYYSNASNFGPFRQMNNLIFSINGNNFSDLNELLGFVKNENYQADTSLIFDDPPITVLKYPLTLNTEWEMINSATLSINKRYVNFENVTVNAGTFYCLKIRKDFSFNKAIQDTGIVYYDYFSESGMIKRDILIKDVNVSNSSGQTIGKINIKEEAFLNLYYISK